ncbi:MAG: hypothetical protein LH650_02760 [Chloroflexi bacterium]|nr:hypothetical protein [Chloroflexota bacterium]
MAQTLPQDQPDTSSVDASGVIDLVCGMSVQLELARPAGLTFIHEGIEYGFCGKGCRLEFQDDPATYLAPDYQPSM